MIFHPKEQRFFFTVNTNQSVQLSRSVVSNSVIPRTAARQAFPSITTSRSLLKLMSIESVTPSNHLILYRPLLLLPSIFPSIRVFFNESVLCIRWPKYRSFRKHQWAFKNTILPKCNLAVIYTLGKNMPVITASNMYFLNLKTFIHFNLIVCLWELTLNTQNAKMLYAHKCL